MLRKQPGPTVKDHKRVESPPESVDTLNTSPMVAPGPPKKKAPYARP